MCLVIRSVPGESVTIGGVRFTVEFNPPSLSRPDHPATPVGAEMASPLPGVQVRLAARQHPGYLAVAFKAPREVLIIRKVAEDVL
jgi:hypothetical protein